MPADSITVLQNDYERFLAAHNTVLEHIRGGGLELVAPVRLHRQGRRDYSEGGAIGEYFLMPGGKIVQHGESYDFPQQLAGERSREVGVYDPREILSMEFYGVRSLNGALAESLERVLQEEWRNDRLVSRAECEEYGFTAFAE